MADIGTLPANSVEEPTDDVEVEGITVASDRQSAAPRCQSSSAVLRLNDEKCRSVELVGPQRRTYAHFTVSGSARVHNGDQIVVNNFRTPESARNDLEHVSKARAEA